ncbi:DUF3181 family protein [Thermosynechococcaceae cyanobacterium BACA0444]|uniref:DUF3181 family protein n=1 Tax=Pseudocalidococcus azoricus BACA0444 TaxID=2918990 RepID=A0AAE4FUI7_9CYAN|nr:DUF3181 family protein [Pseudocalidococcus azoricus]MDS3861817.1 DUF3181 family protein [Pseudocalidococcus azoricus BACA0444]
MSQTTEILEKLAADIGRDVYIDIARWHLYLAEAHLHTVLASEFYPYLSGKPLQAADVKAVLAKIPVKLGGGQAELPLSVLIPPSAQAQLLEILQNWQQEL